MTRAIPLILVVLCSIAQTASAVKVADITRLHGHRSNVLTGLGLVYGLKGTGDGGDFLPAIKPLAAMLSKYSNAATVRELANVQNVALVSITATIPAEGARNGDKVDCHVNSIGAATSLKGGRLFQVPLIGPTRELLALAEGAVEIEDAGTLTGGVIKGGCVMEFDVENKSIVDGQFELILEAPSASWTTANTIAKMVNESEGSQGETLAVVRDAKTVVVTIPKIEQAKPDGFISRVQRLPVPILPSEARVQINSRTGTMIVTGDVEISPVVISHKGLTISTITPTPVPTPRAPVVKQKDLIAVDTTGTGGPKLNDLVNVLDQLKVPAEDRITIIKELHKTGKLHAKLIVE